MDGRRRAGGGGPALKSNHSALYRGAIKTAITKTFTERETRGPVYFQLSVSEIQDPELPVPVLEHNPRLPMAPGFIVL